MCTSFGYTIPLTVFTVLSHSGGVKDEALTYDYNSTMVFTICVGENVGEKVYDGTLLCTKLFSYGHCLEYISWLIFIGAHSFRVYQACPSW